MSTETPWTFHGPLRDIDLDGDTVNRVQRAIERGWRLRGETMSAKCRTWYLEKGSRVTGDVVRMSDAEFHTMSLI